MRIVAQRGQDRVRSKSETPERPVTIGLLQPFHSFIDPIQANQNQCDRIGFVVLLLCFRKSHCVEDFARVETLAGHSVCVSERASQHQMQAFFDNLVAELDKVEFLRPAEKRETMLVNLRNIFARMEPTKQDMHTLHGVIMAIAEGRKGPAKGGVLDGEQATRLRALLAEHGQGAAASESSTVRGLARLLRRNPTDAERLLWQALRSDRRFAGQFKRQTPVGRHIPDFVSFVLRLAIELTNADESAAIGNDRAARRAWLEARGYAVLDIAVADIERDLASELDRIEARILARR